MSFNITVPLASSCRVCKMVLPSRNLYETVSWQKPMSAGNMSRVLLGPAGRCCGRGGAHQGCAGPADPLDVDIAAADGGGGAGAGGGGGLQEDLVGRAGVRGLGLDDAGARVALIGAGRGE
mmetsp:Transcript_103322/g.262390  ORF Transcript_103322/g.262390 Transcript_103322/m.262390 type:complete len:121 (-) Transcript_103322:24-386(-)